ncbi:segregation/condensation protein A [Streptomyces sp. G1]|uniref:segregation/condensation protein A n=1 Tax=Streptomyces sp. G1 TaxID=361572 RepID=UPI00203095E5|nr:segregation/condensation protein A [Streptomyces sp. G1]MCM1976138.1 segregation/condensation protein A [Streptomyces sp. G1]
MTSNDAPTPAARPSGARRRALGRGPGGATTEPAPTAAPPGPGADAPGPQRPEAADPREPEGSAAGEPRPSAPPTPEPSAQPGTGGAPEPAAAGEPQADEPGEPAPEDSEPHGPRTPPAVPEAEGSGTTPERLRRPAPGASGPESVGESEAGAGSSVLGAGASREPEGDGVRPSGSTPRTGASEPEGLGEPQAGAGLSAAGAGESEAPADEDGGVFKVRLANFEGPFDLLLQLISKHKLDVTEVALSKVTDEFMAHIRAMGPDWDLDETTEFLVVAATLLDLKAARLLPVAEVEDEADLALLEARDLLFARLLQYRAYKQIAEIFNQRLEDEARRYPRTVGLEPHHAELLPEVVISIGAEGFARLAVKAMQPKPKPQVYVDHIHAPLVSVQEQARIVVDRLKELGEASFRALVEDTDDTLTVVARFLALLELYREKAVALDQETALGDLIVRWTGGDGEVQPLVTDEFDRPPEAPGDKDEEKKP